MFPFRAFTLFTLKELQTTDETTSRISGENYIINVAAFSRKEGICKSFSVKSFLFEKSGGRVG